MDVSPTALLLGIDTGGTYTDAVVYDETRSAILAKAKSPTTHDDLSVGIRGAIEAVLAQVPQSASDISLVSLSTTLATNALVEGRGRPACLVAIGFGADALELPGIRDSIADGFCLAIDGGHNSYGEPEANLDLKELASLIDDVASRVDAFAITAQFSVRNPSHELAAAELIRERTGRPTTCSHELSAQLNGPKRAVTALLNARLIAMIEDLVTETERSLKEVGINAPLMVVRGDGSLVSGSFVRERPIETILSGPAASLVGAAHLTDVGDGIVSDIGGTTTDIAVLRDGEPQLSESGATVGGHRTMVEAVHMHTHGIGGDSEIRLAHRAIGAQLELGPRRVVPLALIGEHQGNAVRAVLDRQLARDIPSELDGIIVMGTTAGPHRGALDPTEKSLVDSLGDAVCGADELATSTRHVRVLERLIGRGLIRAAGFTPTDAAHVLGLQTNHDPELSRLGAQLLARRRDRYGTPIADDDTVISRAVIDTLVRRSAEALLDAAFDRDGIPTTAAASVLAQAALSGTPQSSSVHVGVAVPVIGLGAPAPLYYGAVAELLGTRAVVPADADVANAIGAVVGRVRLSREISVQSPYRGGFRVMSAEPQTFHDLDEARAHAEHLLRTDLEAAAAAAGAAEIDIETSWVETTVDVDDRPLFVEGTLTLTASGRPQLR